MNWDRAIHHIELAAQGCARAAVLPPTLVPLRVTQLWAVGAILGPQTDLDYVTIALGVDLPVEEVPWLSLPPAAEHWANLTGLAKNPVQRWWRSTAGPIWNHRIVRPVLIWSQATGLAETNLAAVRDGHGADVGLSAPTANEFAAQLAAEQATSLASLRDRTLDYSEHRWGRGTLEPLADALLRASQGYLDVLAASHSERARNGDL